MERSLVRSIDRRGPGQKSWANAGGRALVMVYFPQCALLRLAPCPSRDFTNDKRLLPPTVRPAWDSFGPFDCVGRRAVRFGTHDQQPLFVQPCQRRCAPGRAGKPTTKRGGTDRIPASAADQFVVAVMLVKAEARVRGPAHDGLGSQLGAQNTAYPRRRQLHSPIMSNHRLQAFLQ